MALSLKSKYCHLVAAFSLFTQIPAIAATYTEPMHATAFVNGGVILLNGNNLSVREPHIGGAGNVGVLWPVSRQSSLGVSIGGGATDKKNSTEGQTVKFRFANIATLFNYNFNAKMSARASLGMDLVNTHTFDPGAGTNIINTNALSLGAGLGYQLNNQLALRADYTYTDLDLYLNRFQFGLEWHLS